MIEIDGEFFDDIDNDAKTEYTKKLFPVFSEYLCQAIKIIFDVKIPEFIKPAFLEVCRTGFVMFSSSIKKYPHAYGGIKHEGGEIVSVNTGEHKPVVLLDGNNLFDNYSDQ